METFSFDEYDFDYTTCWHNKFLTGVRKIIVVSNQSNLGAFLLLTTRIAEALVVNITSSKAKKSHSQSNSYS